MSVSVRYIRNNNIIWIMMQIHKVLSYEVVTRNTLLIFIHMGVDKRKKQSEQLPP